MDKASFDNPTPADAEGFAQTALGWRALLLLGLLMMMLASITLVRTRT